MGLFFCCVLLNRGYSYMGSGEHFEWRVVTLSAVVLFESNFFGGSVVALDKGEC